MKKGLLIIASLTVIVAILGGIWWIFLASDEPDDEPMAAAKVAPSIQGYIVDSTGRPIAGARAEIIVENGEARHIETDTDGSFRFDDLTVGTYQISAQAEGFVAGGPPGSKTVEVKLSAAENASSLRDLRLLLQRVGTIRGRVVASGKPVADATVGIYYQSARGLTDKIEPYIVDAAATSDSRGHFELPNLAPGRLQLLIEAPDYALAESRHLVVEPGETLTSIVIDLAPSATIIGEVIDTNGKAVSAELVLRNEAASSGPSARSQRGRADKNGRFYFQNIPAGTYSLTAVAPGFRDTQVDDIQAVVGKVSAHELVMEPGDGLFGRVLDHQGAPVAGAFVLFSALDGAADAPPHAWQRRAITDRDGLFQWADPPAQTFIATAVSPHHADSKPQQMRRGTSNTFELGAPGALSGHVQGPDGRAVQSFSIGVSNFESNGPIAYSTRSIGVERVNDSTGQFRLDQLRPGRYWLSVESADFAPAISELVVVASGALASGVRIQLGQAGRVGGTVRDETNGAPIAGAAVAIFEPGSPFGGNSTRTDEAGRFQLDGVAPGRRSLRISKKGFLTTVAAGLEVAQNREVTRDIALSPQKPGERLKFQGIGAMLSKQEGGVRVQQVFEGHPASQFGLKENDFIRSVDGQEVEDLALSHVVEKIRGEGGVPVELQIERPGQGRLTLEIERGQVIVR